VTATLRVYVVHFGAPEWCAASVASIQASRWVRPFVTVIDNGGAPLSLPGEVTVVGTGGNRGYSGAANLALRAWLATGDELCVIGSHDVNVESDALARLVVAARRAPEFGVLGPAGLPPQSASDERDARVVDREWVSGTLLMLRRSCVEQVGPFDERFGSYVEDVDYCLRARAAGWRVGVAVSAHATHLGSANPRARAMTAANRLLLTALHSTGWRRVRVRTVLLGLAVKAGGRALVTRGSNDRANEARYFRDAWARAFWASFRRRAGGKF
jgi:GT2 family glycosyltransferase